MSGAQIKQEILQEQYIRVKNVLRAVDCFPFFGTLLGLARNGNLIDLDDDIDFACDSRDFDYITAEIEKNFVIETKLRLIDPDTGAGAQSYVISFSNSLLHLDIYFFLASENECIFPVHWTDQRFRPDKWLRVPLELVSKVRKWESGESLSQNDNYSVSDICFFLYGENWAIRQRKNIDYIHSVQNGIPFVRKTRPFERMLGHLNVIYSNTYWIVTNFLVRKFKVDWLRRL